MEKEQQRKKKKLHLLLTSNVARMASYSVRAFLARLLNCPSVLSCSVKFGRKVQYVNYLHELKQHMDLEQLPIPNQVKE